MREISYGRNKKLSGIRYITESDDRKAISRIYEKKDLEVSSLRRSYMN